MSITDDCVKFRFRNLGKIIRYLDGNENEIFRVKFKKYIFWFYLRKYHLGSSEIIEFTTQGAALKAAQKDANTRRSFKKNLINDVKIMV